MLKLGLLTAVALGAMTVAGFAADLPAPAPAVVPPAPATNPWAGGYIGLNVGYGPGTVSSAVDSGLGVSGWFVGGQAGYNFVLSDNVVFGIEGDVNWANESGSNTSIADCDMINWTGAFTGHIGVTSDTLMGYVLGGVAVAGNTYETAVPPGSPTISDTKTMVGWTVGVGASAFVTSNISVFAEYRYSDYGTQDYASAKGVHLTDNSIRGGFNFHFD